MTALLKSIDARTKLAGTNKLEILLFSLRAPDAENPSEVYGINVFKVREVMQAPKITRAPEMPRSVEGMVSLRGALVPVIDLAKYAGIESDMKPGIMIVTEYNEQVQGFLVAAVDTILRLDWSAMRVPPEMISNRVGGLVTAVTELTDGRLVQMMDVETVLADALGASHDDRTFKDIHSTVPPGRTILFADDSSIARKQIMRTLEALDVNYICAINGSQAWSELKKIAASASAAGKSAKDYVQLVLTDVEMPEMDGYMLTRLIKAEPALSGIPVVMHSSLSGASNRQLGVSVGVDEYVPKFGPDKLAQTLSHLLA